MNKQENGLARKRHGKT